MRAPRETGRAPPTLAAGAGAAGGEWRPGRRERAAGAHGAAGSRPRSLTKSAAMRLHALRGANTVARNDAESILAATTGLLEEIARRNGLHPADVVSCIFTATEDLDAEFPAVAARALGFEAVPLLCARESPCQARCRG